MSDTFETISTLLVPFNTGGVAITESTEFASDLELDSLAVMDLVAAIEDSFDITIPINILPELETVGQVAVAVDGIRQG